MPLTVFPNSFVFLKNHLHKPWGLDLSRHWQRVSLDGRENLDTFKSWSQQIEKYRSRSRLVSTVHLQIEKQLLFKEKVKKKINENKN
jgi:hypothetical protein